MPIVIMTGQGILMTGGILLAIYTLFLGPCLISCCAKKESIAYESNTKAKYRSLAFAIAELYWLRMLHQVMQIFLHNSPTLWCDNLGALALASNPVYHARTKNIEVDYHFIHDKWSTRMSLLDICLPLIKLQTSSPRVSPPTSSFFSYIS